MADKKSKPDKPPVMDISRPGKTPPSPNSKSVIVNNRPLLKDPMVVEKEADNSLEKVSKKAKERLLTAPLLETEEPDEPAVADPEVANKEEKAKPEPPAEPAKIVEPKPKPIKKPEPEVEASEPAKPVSPTTPKKVITPIDDKADKPDDKADAKEEPAPAEEPSEPADAKPSEEDAKPTEEAKPGETSSATEENGEGKTEPSKDKQAEAEEEKEAKRQAAIEKLADSKKYYLPINMVEKRRSKHFAAVGILLSLILVVAWVDVALDAGLIRLGNVKPVTHFFSN